MYALPQPSHASLPWNVLGPHSVAILLSREGDWTTVECRSRSISRGPNSHYPGENSPLEIVSATDRAPYCFKVLQSFLIGHKESPLTFQYFPLQEEQQLSAVIPMAVGLHQVERPCLISRGCGPGKVTAVKALTLISLPSGRALTSSPPHFPLQIFSLGSRAINHVVNTNRPHKIQS